jgi:hypothetical protein
MLEQELNKKSRELSILDTQRYTTVFNRRESALKLDAGNWSPVISSYLIRFYRRGSFLRLYWSIGTEIQIPVLLPSVSIRQVVSLPHFTSSLTSLLWETLSLLTFICRYLVPVSVRTQTILTEVYDEMLRSLQDYAGIVSPKQSLPLSSLFSPVH